MPISVICPQCKKKLNAPDAMAGKKVRCAACKAIIAVPVPEEEIVAPDDDLVEPEDTGVIESPPPKKKKKLDPDDEAESDETGITDSPTPAKKKKKAASDDGIESDERKPKGDDDDYGLDEDDERERKRRKKKQRRRDEDDEDDLPRRRSQREEPHRAVMVLVLGIVSIVVACLCPLIAWIVAAIAVNMGNTDKVKMERGVMDPSGQGMNTAGIICAYVGVLLGLINCVAGAVLRSMGQF